MQPILLIIAKDQIYYKKLCLKKSIAFKFDDGFNIFFLGITFNKFRISNIFLYKPKDINKQRIEKNLPSSIIEKVRKIEKFVIF